MNRRQPTVLRARRELHVYRTSKERRGRKDQGTQISITARSTCLAIHLGCHQLRGVGHGKYTSPDTGFIYLGNRTYDPTTAQFLTVDPIEAISRAPYNYADDNPLNYGDSVGLLWPPLAGGAGGADVACGATFEIPGVDLGACGAAGIASGAAALGAAVGVVTAVAGNEGGDEGETELEKRKEAERDNCGDPATSPGSKFKWEGKGPVGSEEGS